MFSPIDIQLNPSRSWHVVFPLLHAGALLAVWYSRIPLLTQLLFSLLIALSCCVLRWPIYPRIERLRWDVDKDEMQLFEQGSALRVESVRSLMVCRWFVFFYLDVAERFLPLPLLVFFDSTSEAGFRRLLVAAHWAPPPGERER